MSMALSPQASVAIHWAGLLAGVLALASPAWARPAGDEQAATRWIQANATPISSFSPDPIGPDFAAIDALVGKARIAGFGEATHGAREFFLLKDRFFRRLVEHDGFTGFAIEANYAAGDALNTYVHGGPGDAEALVEDLGWPWDVEEVLALVRWMRTYNEIHPNKLSFYGVDIQFAPTNLAIAFDYLERAGQADAPTRDGFSDYLAAATDTAAGYKATNGYGDAEMAAIRGRAEALFQYLDSHRPALIAATGEPAYLRARAAALAVGWYFLMQARPADLRFRGFRQEYDVRDRAMADLAEAALEMEGAKGRVFVWAHDAHVSRARAMDARLTMGRYLSDDLGEDYVGVGFAFDRGRFQAFPPGDPSHPGGKRLLSEMRTPPAPADFSEVELRRGPSPAYLIDLRRLDRGTPAYRWFAARRPLRWTGALYSPALMAKHPPISLADSYDGLVFVQETTRARPMDLSRARFGIPKTW